MSNIKPERMSSDISYWHEKLPSSIFQESQLTISIEKICYPMADERKPKPREYRIIICRKVSRWYPSPRDQEICTHSDIPEYIPDTKNKKSEKNRILPCKRKKWKYQSRESKKMDNPPRNPLTRYIDECHECDG